MWDILSVRLGQERYNGMLPTFLSIMVNASNKENNTFQIDQTSVSNVRDAMEKLSR